MQAANDREIEIKKWLTVALTEENLENFSVEITGNSQKGEGAIGDVYFVIVRGTDRQGKNKEYHLVVKCSKSSSALTENMPLFKKAFVREIFVYENIFPLFQRFEEEKGIEKPFDSVPKCYGVYSDEFKYVIVLENLKNIGYDLWPKGKPLTREVINIVLKNYARFHAISVAVKEQKPDTFKTLVENLKEDLFKVAFESGFLAVSEDAVEEAYQLLKNDLEETDAKKMLTLKEKAPHICYGMVSESDVQVINHGDCWVNNFLYKFENKDKTNVSKVAILDWQITKFTSPVLDLSYFLFTGISKEDIADIDTILMDYYNYFSDCLTKLGSNLPKEYTVNTFFDDWKKYSKYGALMCILPIKSFYSEKEDLPDLAERADCGEELSETFKFEASDNSGYKNRLKPIFEYVIKNELI